MNRSKADILLSQMNVYELNRLGKFLTSPYHNEDDKLVSLFNFLMPYYKAKKPRPGREMIWGKVYRRQKYTNLKFARLLSDLLKKTEAFIAVERMFREGDSSLYILSRYNEIGLVHHFAEPYRAALQRIDKQPFRDSEYYFHSFRLNEQLNINIESKKERNSEKHLAETIHSFDTYYLINKLRFSAALLHYRHFLNLSGAESTLLSEILQYLQRINIEVPIVDIYYHVVLTLIEPDQEQHFLKLKELLFANANTLRLESQKEIFAFALNYCIRKINKGQQFYQAEIFQLYKDALQRSLMMENGVMTPWDYKNIVTIGLRNKEYDWTEKFIESYIDKLTKSEQQNAYTFNKARYYFAIAKYDKVLELLQNVEYNDIFYLLDSKTTLMKTYYELGEYQPLQSLKESFRILLRRKKVISEQNQSNYGNFARFAMKLYRADPKNKVKLSGLRKSIESTANIADKTWIMEKLAQLGA